MKTISRKQGILIFAAFIAFLALTAPRDSVVGHLRWSATEYLKNGAPS